VSRAGFTPTPGTVADRLQRRLLALEYPAFARCVCSLLEDLGYEEARPAGRHEWKGYNRPGGGGYDLEATLPGGVASRRVVAQIKQFDGLRVHQRSVDELRGACLRAGAAEALLVTTSAFSDVVRSRAASPHPSGTLVAPVRLIDGEELLGLLIRYRLGVRERGQGEARRLDIDETFFRKVTAPIEKPPISLHRSPSLHSPDWQGLRVTVRIFRSGSPRTRRGRTEGER